MVYYGILVISTIVCYSIYFDAKHITVDGNYIMVYYGIL